MRGFVLLALFGAAIIAAVCLLIKMSADSKRERGRALEAEGERRKSLKKAAGASGALCAASFVHIKGLPLEGGVPCIGCACDDCFIFVRDELRISLPFEKIQDAALTTRKELRDSGRLTYAAGTDGDKYLALLYRKDGETDESAFLYCGCPDEARELLEVFYKSPARARSVEL